MLSALVVKGQTPVVALVTVRDPFSSHLFIDPDAIREFAQGARGMFTAMGKRPVLAPSPTITATMGTGSGVRSWGRLSGSDWSALQAAFLSAFPSSGDLEQLMALELGVNLNTIATGNLSEKVYGIIQWSQSHGKTEELFRAARRRNPGNPALRNLDR